MDISSLKRVKDTTMFFNHRIDTIYHKSRNNREERGMDHAS